MITVAFFKIETENQIMINFRTIFISIHAFFFFFIRTNKFWPSLVALKFLHNLTFEPQLFLRWLEIVSWRVRPGPLIARGRASTPGSRRCKFSDLVPSKILQNLYFD